MKVLFSLLAVAVIGSVSTLQGAEKPIAVRISAGETARRSSPASQVIFTPQEWGDDIVAEAATSDGKSIPSQVTGLSLLDDRSTPAGKAPHRIWFAVPDLTAGATIDLTVTLKHGKPEDSAAAFHWRDEAGQYNDLLFGERPVMRYQYAAYVNAEDKRDLNNKPFHHLFDSEGKMLVTKGSGGFYTHHQGLFYGFTRITRDGETANLWYCHDGEYQSHEEVIEEVAGPVLGRHRVKIIWRNQKGEPLCIEIREMTAFNTSGGTLVEFASQLSSAKGTVVLDGDPQHAGFQFRAADEVAVREKENLTYYLRVHGKGALGETRNAPEDTAMSNLPWNAMSFVLGEKRFTALYLDHPQNPKPSFYSERVYGRFGSWFGSQTLTEEGTPVKITYRVWLQDGEMTVEDCQGLSTNFATPADVEVLSEK